MDSSNEYFSYDQSGEQIRDRSIFPVLDDWFTEDLVANSEIPQAKVALRTQLAAKIARSLKNKRVSVADVARSDYDAGQIEQLRTKVAKIHLAHGIPFIPIDYPVTPEQAQILKKIADESKLFQHRQEGANTFVYNPRKGYAELLDTAYSPPWRAVVETTFGTSLEYIRGVSPNLARYYRYPIYTTTDQGSNINEQSIALLSQYYTQPTYANESEALVRILEKGALVFDDPDTKGLALDYRNAMNFHKGGTPMQTATSIGVLGVLGQRVQRSFHQEALSVQRDLNVRVPAQTVVNMSLAVTDLGNIQ